MAYPRNIHLFNCDRTYSLDAVEDWLRGAKAKLGFVDFAIKQHYFTLPQMSKMSSVTIPALEIDLAVFVVHAHESRLSINEENAGIGYAKIYRALEQRTGNRVIIVIGGDDNYKDKDEEDRQVISRWARRKVSSQFSEEFMDGRKSFIFSWDKKHRKVHEEALLHFLDPNKKEKKFEYQPPKPPSQQLPPRGPEQSGRYRGAPYDQLTRGKKTPQENKPKQRPDLQAPYPILQDTLQGDYLFEEKKPECGSGSAEMTITPKTHRVPYGQLTGERKTHQDSKPQQQARVKHAQQWDDHLEKRKTEYSSASSSQGRKNQTPPRRTTKIVEQKDLSVLGWNAKPESLLAVTRFIEKHRVQLNLTEDPGDYDGTMQDLKLYLENHPLKYCVLVVDAQKVISVAREKKKDYLKLLEAADKHVEVQTIVVVCCPLSMSAEKEMSLTRAIESVFKDNDKMFVVRLKDGEPALEGSEFINLFISAFITPRTYPPGDSHSLKYHQTPGLGISQPYVQENSASNLSHGSYNQTTSFNSQYVPQQQEVVTTTKPFDPPTSRPFSYKLMLSPAKTIVVLTRLRNGGISERQKDVDYWMPGFAVPDDVKRDLRNNYSNKTDVELAILVNEQNQVMCWVDKKIDPEKLLQLELDETIMLQTRLKNGRISFENKDVGFRLSNWQVPEDAISQLSEEHRMTPNAVLFFIRNSKGKIRSIVQVDAFRSMTTSINKTIGQPLI